MPDTKTFNANVGLAPRPNCGSGQLFRLRGWLLGMMVIMPYVTEFCDAVTPDESGNRSSFSKIFRLFRSERYDPADPTQLNTYATGNLQLNSLRTPQGRGMTYGLSLEAGYVLDAVDNYALGFELPLLQSDIPGKIRRFGLGDMTINNSFVPYRTEDPETFWNAGGVLCSITVPSGDFNAGLSSGNWQVAPSIVLSFQLGPLRAIPILGYQFAIPGSGELGKDRGPLSEGPSADVVLLGPIPDPWYIALTPHYFFDRLAPTDAHSCSLNLQAGRLIGKRLNQSLQLEITQELVQRIGTQSTVNLSYTYFY